MADEQIRLKRAWEPVKNESASAYAAFCLYRDLGPTRSVAEVLRHFQAMGEAVTKDSLYKWSNAYDWDDRALKWEAHLQEAKTEIELREAKRSVIKLQREREKRIEVNLLCADQLRFKALQMLDYPLERCIKTEQKEGPDGKTILIQKFIEPNKWGVRDAAILIRTALDMEKLSLFKDDKNTLDTSGETLGEAETRLASWRSDMATAIEGFSSDSPPGTLSNPIEGEASAE